MNIEKISFLKPNSDELDNLLSTLDGEEKERASEIVSSFLEADFDASFAFSVTEGTLVVRVFDGIDYSFIFPYEISEDADLPRAIESIVKYAVLEEIGITFECVPKECVAHFFTLGYRRIESAADSVDNETYRVVLKNECELVSDYPEAEDSEGMTLSRLADDDAESYARLCSDAENNKYWGYDYREDNEALTGEDFLEMANMDYASNSALTFAVRSGGSFLGEALISSFDYKGGADVSIRILPEQQKKGYARRALSLLFEIAREIGLTTLYARVYNENLSSIRLFARDADEKQEKNEIAIFTYNLY